MKRFCRASSSSLRRRKARWVLPLRPRSSPLTRGVNASADARGYARLRLKASSKTRTIRPLRSNHNSSRLLATILESRTIFSKVTSFENFSNASAAIGFFARCEDGFPQKNVVEYLQILIGGVDFNQTSLWRPVSTTVFSTNCDHQVRPKTIVFTSPPTVQPLRLLCHQ